MYKKEKNTIRLKRKYWHFLKQSFYLIEVFMVFFIRMNARRLFDKEDVYAFFFGEFFYMK